MARGEPANQEAVASVQDCRVELVEREVGSLATEPSCLLGERLGEEVLSGRLGDQRDQEKERRKKVEEQRAKEG